MTAPRLMLSVFPPDTGGGWLFPWPPPRITAGNVRQLTKGRLHQLVHLGQFHADHGLQQMEHQFLGKSKNRLPVQIVYQLIGDKNIPLGLVRADRFQLRTAYDKPMIKQSALLSA